MTKKILHFQIPLEQNKPYKDALAISAEILGKFMQLCKTSLEDNWLIIASPCIPSISLDAENFYNFKMEQLSKEDLMSFVELGRTEK